MQKTLMLLKPDAVNPSLQDEILSRLDNAWYTFTYVKEFTFTEDLLKQFYSHLYETIYFPRIKNFMTSWKCIAFIVEWESVIQWVRDLAGATDPQKAEKWTIRWDYWTELPKNVIHASDSTESFERELWLLNN